MYQLKNILIMAIGCALLAVSARAASTDEIFASSLGDISALGARYRAEGTFAGAQSAIPPDVATTAQAQLKLGNTGLVLPGIYRGAMPYGASDYRALAALGIDTVVNLRYLKTDADSAKYCAANDFDCEQYRLMLLPAQDKYFDWDTFKHAFRFIVYAHQAGHKVYIHCLHGSDRTGAMAAALTVRAAACGGQFDKAALWNKVDGDLKAHNFHMVYASLYAGIKDMVYKFDENREWLCAK
jgi:protein-tyrosine phosphatase